MGIEDLGLLLENIEEYVMEQKKVVTYKWLSRTFSLNVNQAKQLLAIFHMKHKNMKHKSIQGVYYVSGMRHNSQGVLTHQVCIVNEDMLEETKSQLDPVTSVHLYSVQKGKPKGTAPMYSVDFEQLKKKVYETTEFSMVRCKEAKISQVINSGLRPVTPPALKNKVKIMTENKTVETKKHTTINAKKTFASKKPAEVKKSTAKKQEGLANFFGKGKAEAKKAEPRKIIPKSAPKPEPKTSPKTLKSAPKSEPKSAPKPEPKTSPKTLKSAPKSEPKSAPKPEHKPESKPLSKKNPTKSEPPTRTSPRKQSLMNKNRGGNKTDCTREPLFVDIVEDEVEEVKVLPKPKSNGKDSRAGTKRKRVMKFSDDEDDELEIKTEEQVPKKATESPEKKKPKESPDSKKPKVRRKRIRKQVNKTSVNDDGFMVTEKVWETFSCSDNEDEKKEEEEEKMDTEESTKKEVPTTRNKQSSLMGFFKKG
ncbi:DNA polymerase delta subunit 3-like isoform X3 [Bolinopsis microptera]|uniref:DNA polymerase delta subunit 3-like isoform X3 n=1 Tax=Bolinopsis microptera TaxID=2820187 RepID=UPI00307AFA97